MNNSWPEQEANIQNAVASFESGVSALQKIFGPRLARKPGSPQFNRAIFDALIYFHSQDTVRVALVEREHEVSSAYDSLFMEGSPFLKAIESDTAGAPNTATRFRLWADALSFIVGETLSPPAIPLSRQNKESDHTTETDPSSRP